MLTVDPYPYQDEAINLVLDLGYGLIAYEMGLGKTIVGIAVVEELLAKPDINFALIIVPSGLKYQWAESIAKFTDVDTRVKKVQRETITIPTDKWCVVVDGNPRERAAQYDYIDANWPNYVIVSYEQVVNDFAYIKALEPDCIIIDEATAIKGFKAQRSKKVKRLGLQTDYRVALSGTPLENRPEEVFSIMEFVAPEVLGRFEKFDVKYIVRNGYGAVKRYRNLDILNQQLRKVMSRKTRLDPDVAPYMPKVSSKNEYVFLPKKAQKLYDEIAAETVKELQANPTGGAFDIAAYYRGEGDNDMSQQGRIMAKLLALQMLCNHPELLRDSGEKYLNTGGQDGSKYAATLLEKGRLDDLGTPEKMNQVVEDVINLLEMNPANKIIIFSFFTGMVDRLQTAFSDYDSVRYTGQMNTGEKAAAKARFQNNEDCRLFIASDAGAFGVDLPQANYLINYDEVDSAGKMDQRNARHVRAGSKHKNVFIINYLVDGSIEERRHARLAFKRKVSRAVIDGGVSDGGVLENDVDSLTMFLAEHSEVVEEDAS